MRIIAGQYRGTALASVGKGDAGAHLRPTTDRVRESLFNVLSGGRFDDPITDARVLDLFAGTGALGLEALSRGAAHVTFVDSGRKAQSLIRENIAKLGAGSQTTLITGDATKHGVIKGGPFDLVFLDPPYGQGMGEKALSHILGLLSEHALIICEETTPLPPLHNIAVIETRKYGQTYITFLRPT